MCFHDSSSDSISAMVGVVAAAASTTTAWDADLAAVAATASCISTNDGELSMGFEKREEDG